MGVEAQVCNVVWKCEPVMMNSFNESIHHLEFNFIFNSREVGVWKDKTRE